MLKSEPTSIIIEISREKWANRKRKDGSKDKITVNNYTRKI